jgi:hypothetical protein
MLRLRADAVFEIASDPCARLDRTAIVVYRTGGMHVVSTTEWSLPAIIHEFGAIEVYLIDRKSGKLTVEAWSPTGGCTVSDRLPKSHLSDWKRDTWFPELEAMSAH